MVDDDHDSVDDEGLEVGDGSGSICISYLLLMVGQETSSMMIDPTAVLTVALRARTGSHDDNRGTRAGQQQQKKRTWTQFDFQV